MLAVVIDDHDFVKAATKQTLHDLRKDAFSAVLEADIVLHEDGRILKSRYTDVPDA